MAVSAAGKFVSGLCATRGTVRSALASGQCFEYLQSRQYAARKGTREKAKKKKVKVVVEKVGFIPHNLRGAKLDTLPLHKVRCDDSLKLDIPGDDVWVGWSHKWRIFPFDEAIQCHKETHSMGMLDKPDAYVVAHIELDMKGPKPSRPVNKFERLISVPHRFDYGKKRTVVAFSKIPEHQEEAMKAGATLAGGPELINQIQTGAIKVAEFEHFVAHPNMMAELLVIKGLLKKKFPTTGTGSLGVDLPAMVDKFALGLRYSGQPHERHKPYGICDIVFGKLDMDTKQLEENFIAVVSDLNAHRPKRPGEFITRIRIRTELMKEYIKVDHKLYTETKTDATDEDDEEDDEPVAAAI